MRGLAEGLRGNSTLTALDVSHTGFGPSGVSGLCGACFRSRTSVSWPMRVMTVVVVVAVASGDQRTGISRGWYARVGSVRVLRLNGVNVGEGFSAIVVRRSSSDPSTLIRG